jgi:hypothetical protein
MAYNRYNVRMRRSLPKGLLALAAVVAGMTVLASAQGGVFPGSNGLVAYTCGSGLNICTFDPNSLSKTPAFITGASDPSWSSDEDSIAYISTVGGLTVADSDGTFPFALGATATSKQPTFSLDGNSVAYVLTGLGIYMINSDGTGNEQPIAMDVGPTTTDVDPAYSPDGSKIAFARNDGATGYDIWTVTVPGGVTHQVTNAARPGLAPARRSCTRRTSAARVTSFLPRPRPGRPTRARSTSTSRERTPRTHPTARRSPSSPPAGDCR